MLSDFFFVVVDCAKIFCRLRRACRVLLPRWHCMRPCRASAMSCAEERTALAGVTVGLEIHLWLKILFLLSFS